MTSEEFTALQKGDIIELTEGRLDACHYDNLLGERSNDIGKQLMIDYVYCYRQLVGASCFGYLIYNNLLHKNLGTVNGYYIIHDKDAHRFKLVQDA